MTLPVARILAVKRQPKLGEHSHSRGASDIVQSRHTAIHRDTLRIYAQYVFHGRYVPKYIRVISAAGYVRIRVFIRIRHVQGGVCYLLSLIHTNTWPLRPRAHKNARPAQRVTNPEPREGGYSKFIHVHLSPNTKSAERDDLKRQCYVTRCANFTASRPAHAPCSGLLFSGTAS